MGSDVLHDLLVMHRLDVRHGNGGSDRVTTEGRAVVEQADLGLPDVLEERPAHDDPTERKIGTRDPFGEGDHVGDYPEAFAAEEVTEATKRTDDLVSTQQHAVFVADAAEFLPVTVRRHKAATAVLDRFSDDQGNGFGPLGEDHVLDGLGARKNIGGVAVGVANVAWAVPEHRQEVLAELRHAGDRKGGDGGAVVAPFSRDDLVTALVATSDVVVAGELECRLDGFGTRRHEEDVLEVTGSDVGDHRRRLAHRLVREAPVRVERHALHLLARLGGKITAAVAEVRAEEPGETIEVALALGIGDITTFGVIHHDEVVGVPGRPLGEVWHDMRLRSLAKIHSCPPLESPDRSPLALEDLAVWADWLTIQQES